MISLHPFLIYPWAEVDLGSIDNDYRDKEVLFCTWQKLFWWMDDICFQFHTSFDLILSVFVCERRKWRLLYMEGAETQNTNGLNLILITFHNERLSPRER